MLIAHAIDSNLSSADSFCFRCDQPCSASCVGGTCFPDLSCKVCKVNHWGPKCESTCHDHCQDAVGA